MRNRTLLPLLLALAFSAHADDAPPVKGTLCFMANRKLADCAPVTGTALTVTPSDVARPFVWTRDDGTRAAAGILAASAGTIDLAAKEWREVSWRVSGDPTRGWPLETTVHVGSADRTEWSWTLPAKTVKAFATLLLPDGRYRLGASAEHHQDTSRTITVAGKPVNAGEARLIPLPLITGSVVTRKERIDVPVVGASLTRPSGDVLGASDEKGQFRLELKPPPPDGLVIRQEGLASRSVILPRESVDIPLGVIRLEPGSTLTVNVVRHGLEARALTVDLLREEDRVYELTHADRRELAARATAVTFPNVAPGKHFVLISGSGPLERLSKEVTVDDKKPTDVELEIRPYMLDGMVHFGTDPLTEGTITFGPARDRSWRSEQAVGADGRFGGTMWQRGQQFGFVTNRQLFGAPLFTMSPELGVGDPSSWTIDIAKRYVEGDITDEETKATLPRATVFMRANLSEKENVNAAVPVDAAGHYRVLSAQAGSYEIGVSLEGYLRESKTVQVADGDCNHRLDFALSHGNGLALELVWPNGAPVANATILQGSLGRGLFKQTTRSDEAGHALVRGRAGEAETLYVLPPNGSIGVAHVTVEGSEGRPARFVVPQPLGTLRIVGVDADGKPSRAGWLLRWNGELIPYEVLMRRFANHLQYEGDDLVLPSLQGGLYDVWPLIADLPEGAVPAQAPVQAAVTTGETTVRVVVPPRKK
jgi:hypothetical protein